MRRLWSASRFSPSAGVVRARGCACEHDYVAALAGSEDNAKLGLTMARPWTFVCKGLGGLQEHFTRSWAFSGPRKRGWARVISKCRIFLAVN
jgi:hypothetical protein